MHEKTCEWGGEYHEDHRWVYALDGAWLLETEYLASALSSAIASAFALVKSWGHASHGLKSWGSKCCLGLGHVPVLTHLQA